MSFNLRRSDVFAIYLCSFNVISVWCIRSKSLSTPMYALWPKCHAFPFITKYVSGLHFYPCFFIDGGTETMVESTNCRTYRYVSLSGVWLPDPHHISLKRNNYHSLSFCVSILAPALYGSRNSASILISQSCLFLQLFLRDMP